MLILGDNGMSARPVGTDTQISVLPEPDMSILGSILPLKFMNTSTFTLVCGAVAKGLNMYFFITTESYYAIYKTCFPPAGRNYLTSSLHCELRLHERAWMWTSYMHARKHIPTTVRQGADGWVWTNSLSGKVESKKKKKKEKI